MKCVAIEYSTRKMNNFVFAVGLLQVAAVFSSAIPYEEVLYKEGDRYAYIADDNFKVHLVDLWEPPAPFASRNNPVHYYLFSRQNPAQGEVLVHGDASSIQASNFRNDSDTVFIIHGWLGGVDFHQNALATNEYLNVFDVNIIVVDWSSLAGSNYISAAAGTPDIGIEVGQFINFLGNIAGISTNKIHLIGFSLGAHVAGVAGRIVEGTIGRITGLDPAGPGWGASSQRLRPTDARYVEAIHTNGGLTGIGDRVADADFYPNGGTNMPGCIRGMIGSLCSHLRAFYFFIESITHDRFVGNLCASEADARSGNGCSGAAAVMGTADINKSLSGAFFLRTSSSSPFS